MCQLQRRDKGSGLGTGVSGAQKRWNPKEAANLERCEASVGSGRWPGHGGGSKGEASWDATVMGKVQAELSLVWSSRGRPRLRQISGKSH